MHLLLQRVPLHVHVLQVGKVLESLDLDVGDEVLARHDLDEGGDLREDRGHLEGQIVQVLFRCF